MGLQVLNVETELVPSFTPSVFEVVTEVISNDQENDSYNHLILKTPEDALGARPGQFFHLLCPQSDGLTPYLRRPMSVYRIEPNRQELHFLYKVTGEGTNAMATLQPGDPFNILGPLGAGFWLKPEWKSLVLVARGVGLATLGPLVQEAARLDKKIIAICSARSPEHIMSKEYFEEHGAEVITLTDSEGTSNIENLESIINDLIAEGRCDALFTCGSNRILTLLKAIGKSHNIPGQIALEQQMACGLGMCVCCVRPFSRNGETVDLRVCKEGPVFDLQEALPW